MRKWYAISINFHRTTTDNNEKIETTEQHDKKSNIHGVISFLFCIFNREKKKGKERERDLLTGNRANVHTLWFVHETTTILPIFYLTFETFRMKMEWMVTCLCAFASDVVSPCHTFISIRKKQTNEQTDIRKYLTRKFVHTFKTNCTIRVLLKSCEFLFFTLNSQFDVCVSKESESVNDNNNEMNSNWIETTTATACGTQR